MTGIIKKNLYLLKNLNSSFFIFLGLFVLIPVFTGNFTMTTVMLPFIVSTFAINLLAYDRQCDWDQYAAALPVSRRQSVLALYIVSFSLVAAGSVVGLLLSLIASRFVENGPSAGVLLGSAAAGLACVLIYLSVIIPLTYKFGVEKSRVFVMLIVMLPMLLMYAFMNSEVIGKIANMLNSVSPAVFAVIVIAVVAAICVATYFISAAIYEKKEF